MTADARGLLDGVVRGYSSPHPCGPCDLGVQTNCNCIDQDEVVRRLETALTAVLDLADKWEHGATRWEHPLPVPPEVDLVRGAIGSALAADSDEQESEVRVGGCTCNAVFMGPGSGHESYCGWENP